MTRIGRPSTDQATRARKWLSSRRHFAPSSPVWMSRFRHFPATSTTAQAGNSPTKCSSQLVYDATRNAGLITPPRVRQSTVGESHHSDMLPSCHLHSSQKTCRRWSNCGDGYPNLKSFQSSQASLTENREKLVFRNGDAPQMPQLCR